jgi:hypothetical protein
MPRISARPTLVFAGLALAGFLSTATVWTVLVRRAYQPDHSGLESQWIAAIQEKKRNAIGVPGRKVIFVGGSATLFGVSARTAREQLNSTCINMGSHAGLGMSFLLREASLNAKAGDLIVLSIEYDLWRKDQRPSETLVSYLLGSPWPEVLRASPLLVVRCFLSPSFSDIAALLGWSFSPERVAAVREKAMPPTDYTVATISDLGDETNHPVSGRAKEIERYELHGDAFLNPVIAGQFQAFLKKARAGGITVLACNPPRLVDREADIDQPAPFFRRICAYYESLGVPVLFGADLRHDEEAFFDTAYHLTDEGAEEYTLKLCGALKQNREFVAWERRERLAAHGPQLASDHASGGN